MARALQSAVLAQDHPIETTFASIQEGLDNNTQLYYDALAAVCEGELTAGR